MSEIILEDLEFPKSFLDYLCFLARPDPMIYVDLTGYDINLKYPIRKKNENQHVAHIS